MVDEEDGHESGKRSPLSWKQGREREKKKGLFEKDEEMRGEHESRTVGKSHEWPRNVNEAPVT